MEGPVNMGGEDSSMYCRESAIHACRTLKTLGQSRIIEINVVLVIQCQVPWKSFVLEKSVRDHNVRRQVP